MNQTAPALPIDYNALSNQDVCTILDIPPARLSSWLGTYPALRGYTRGEYGQPLPQRRMRWTEMTLLRLAIFAALADLHRPIKNKAALVAAAELAARDVIGRHIYFTVDWEQGTATRVCRDERPVSCFVDRMPVQDRLRNATRAHLAARMKDAA